MHFNEIDEILKKSLQDSERKSDDFAMEAQHRIWESIEKPRKQSGLYWGFVLAMAAAVLFFLISTFLFLKLQSKQEELVALKTVTSSENRADKITGETVEKYKAIKSENQSIVLNKQVPELKKDINSSRQHIQINKEVKEKAVEESAAEIVILDYPITELKVSDIEIPEIDITELKAELISPEEIKEENQAYPKTKTPSKIRFRFGNSEPSYNSNNSLALTIKL
jgi:hypothetical protein